MTREDLRRLGASPKKKLGQNFMTGKEELASIAAALRISPGEDVVEIGPGLGALTEALLETGARVTAVEKDAPLAKALCSRWKERPFRVLQKDILKFRLSEEFSRPVKVAGNIPYNITSPILEWLIEEKPLVSEAVLTVQWEVARRLAAKPGGKEWGSLSFFVQYHADVELLRKIDKSRFYPVPKVDSGVVHLRFRTEPRFPAADEAHLFRCVRKAFQKRRKTLLNALWDDAMPSREALAGALETVSIDPRRRAETLTLAEWAKLSDSLGSLSQK